MVGCWGGETIYRGSLPHSLPPSLSLSLCLSVCVCDCLYVCLCLSLTCSVVCLSVCLFLCLCLCLSLSVCLSAFHFVRTICPLIAHLLNFSLHVLLCKTVQLSHWHCFCFYCWKGYHSARVLLGSSTKYSSVRSYVILYNYITYICTYYTSRGAILSLRRIKSTFIGLGYYVTKYVLLSCTLLRFTLFYCWLSAIWGCEIRVRNEALSQEVFRFSS